MARSDRCRAVLIAALLIMASVDHAHAQIRFNDFASSEQLSLVGDARMAGNVLRITPARADKAGAFWYRDKQSVRAGFDTMFQFRLTHQDWPFFRGAVGFTFFVQNSRPDALGGKGSAAGFEVSDQIGTPSHVGIPFLDLVAVFCVLG